MTTAYLTDAVLLNNYRGWIMESIAIESAQAISHRPRYIYLPSSRRELLNLKALKGLIRRNFSNSLILGFETYSQMLRFGKVDEQTCNLYFTHQNYPIDKELLNRFSQILVMNMSLKTKMVNFGVSESKVRIVYGAVNKEVFKPFRDEVDKHIDLPETFVLLSSDCKPRKNPKKILNLIRSLPDINFVIHGKGWKIAFEKEMRELKNLMYLDFDYQIQPLLMRKAATFMSLSTLEGGPYPLLEALSSGTPVVASRTGFAEDFLDRSNGFIVEHETSLEEIALTLRKSIALKARLREQNLLGRDLSWELLGKHLYSIYF